DIPRLPPSHPTPPDQRSRSDPTTSKIISLGVLRDEHEHERALGYLITGTAYQLTLHDESSRYVLVAYPPGVIS
ncbi:hypothetical protein ACFW6R_00005, partial [Streptomyces albidoflavus]